MRPHAAPRLLYCSFVLRCWRKRTEPAEDAARWRFSLAHIGNGESPCGFATLDDLAAYLRAYLAELTVAGDAGLESGSNAQDPERGSRT